MEASINTAQFNYLAKVVENTVERLDELRISSSDNHGQITVEYHWHDGEIFKEHIWDTGECAYAERLR